MSDEEMPVPEVLKVSGARMWRNITAEWELDPPALELLLQACKTLDEADRLAAALEDAEPFVKGSTGQVRPHPGFDQLRLHRATLAKLLDALDLEDEDESPKSWTQQRASDAARARWEYARRNLKVAE